MTCPPAGRKPAVSIPWTARRRSPGMQRIGTLLVTSFVSALFMAAPDVHAHVAAAAPEEGGDNEGGDNEGDNNDSQGNGDRATPEDTAQAAACPTIYQSPATFRANYETAPVDLGPTTMVAQNPVQYMNLAQGEQGKRGWAMYSALLALKATNAEIRAAFVGKGRPIDIASALLAVWTNWDALEKQGLVAAKSGSAADDLADVYAKRLGLDCSGFVGNWARANGSTAVGPETPVTDWAANSRVSFQRKSLAAVCPGDVIQYKNAGHVAVIAEVDRTGNRVFVIESCAETGCVGLQSEWHTIRHNSEGTFTIQQEARTRTDHPVHIAPVL